MFKDTPRPSHGDFGWMMKYGNYDYNGGGRGSGRITIGHVIGGAIAKKLLKPQNIEDITAIVALYRPGPMDKIDIYIGNTVTGEVTINYNNSKLLADNLNVLMADWFTDTGEITVANNTHYELIFFKTDAPSYDPVNIKINGNNVVINLN